MLSLRVLLTVIATVIMASQLQAAPRQPLGERIEVRPQDMPAPYATPMESRSSITIRRPAGASLRVPPGFRANIFRDGLTHPRWLVVAENGDVILSETRPGLIQVLRDSDGDGHAEMLATFSDEIGGVHGLAIHDEWLYVSNPRRVFRFAYRAGQLRSQGPAQPVTPQGALGDGRGHWTRNLAIAADGKSMFVAIGSRSNAAEEPLPRASVQQFALDGSGGRTIASGLRNPVGIAVYPGSDDLYVVVNERDGLGDGLVPDYFTRVREGAFYGWPYAYIGPHPDPEYGDRRPDLVAKTVAPDVLFRSHSAPLGLVFYDADQFPADYRGDAFVALHGSWNASKPTGYKIVRVPFKAGRPAGWYENFATGFWFSGDSQAKVWGRPVGLAVAKDGSLLIADDAGGTIWRISYEK